MKKLNIIALCLFFLPLFASAQEVSNGPDNCAIAEKFTAHFSEVKKDAELSIISNSDCRLIIQPTDGSQVLSFDLSINENKSFIIETAKEGMLTMSMQTRIGKVPAGTKVYIENIVVKGADGKEHKLKPVTVVM